MEGGPQREYQPFNLWWVAARGTCGGKTLERHWAIQLTFDVCLMLLCCHTCVTPICSAEILLHGLVGWNQMVGLAFDRPSSSACCWWLGSLSMGLWGQTRWLVWYLTGHPVPPAAGGSGTTACGGHVAGLWLELSSQKFQRNPSEILNLWQQPPSLLFTAHYVVHFPLDTSSQNLSWEQYICILANLRVFVLVPIPIFTQKTQKDLTLRQGQ